MPQGTEPGKPCLLVLAQNRIQAGRNLKVIVLYGLHVPDQFLKSPVAQGCKVLLVPKLPVQIKGTVLRDSHIPLFKLGTREV